MNTSQFIKYSLSEIKSKIKEDVINTADHHPVFMEIHFNKLLVNSNEQRLNFDKITAKEANFIKI
jgi:hypothetical protein